MTPEATKSRPDQSATRPSRPLDAFIDALGQIHAGLRDRIDLVTSVWDATRTKSELYSALAKQTAVKDGVVFPDDEIRADVQRFMSGLIGGADAQEKFHALAARVDEGTNRQTIVSDHATHVDHSNPYVDELIWELPTVHPNTVIGLSIYADDSGVLSWSYYVGVPYRERVGLRGVQHAVSRTATHLWRDLIQANP